MKLFEGRIIPDDALVIPIRENYSVAIFNLPYDLSQKEFEKITRIILALTEQPSGESDNDNR